MSYNLCYRLFIIINTIRGTHGHGAPPFLVLKVGNMKHFQYSNISMVPKVLPHDCTSYDFLDLPIRYSPRGRVPFSHSRTDNLFH